MYHLVANSDIARLYQIETRTLNRRVKRNLERFPDDFYFQLTKEEFDELWFQNGTTNMSRSLPHVFTERGVAMLSSVLKSEIASNVSVGIMRAFVKMRKYIFFISGTKIH